MINIRLLAWTYRLLRTNRRNLFLMLCVISVFSVISVMLRSNAIPQRIGQSSYIENNKETPRKLLELGANNHELLTKKKFSALRNQMPKIISKKESNSLNLDLVSNTAGKQFDGQLTNDSLKPGNDFNAKLNSLIDYFHSGQRHEESRNGNSLSNFNLNGRNVNPYHNQEKSNHKNDPDVAALLEVVKNLSDRENIGSDTILKFLDKVLQRKLKDDDELNTSNDELSNTKSFDGFSYPQSVDMQKIIEESTTQGYVSSVTPVNRYPYKPIYNPASICTDVEREPVFLLYVVKTKPDNLDERRTIRSTWGDSTRFPNVRTVFSLGIPSKFSIAKKVSQESSHYGDILLIDYADTYENLTLKTIGGVNWAVEFCNQAKYVISVDDDMYVATDFVLQHLKTLKSQQNGHFYSGFIYRKTKPIRYAEDDSFEKKWVLTKSEYPFHVFPNYAFGGFIMMSMKTAQIFKIAFPFVKHFKFEDVYIGIVASKVGIEPTENKFVDHYKTYSVSEKFKTLMASHYYTEPWDLRRAWECHLAIVENNQEKLVYCKYLEHKLKKLKQNIDEILGWISDVRYSL